ncbi:hypothetical protein ANCCAN_21950 [Ancylostoma caninum]|uniref:Ion transport domain-containing protein n=1 Tax=Ancylostoma caninum TaxID=29170 RepID=A0A368FJ19_ANCCA|nr:hypothetical protein ANCCAN_21950 [Ancylostoma caninum]
MEKPRDEYEEKLLVRASKDPGFAKTVDLDSPLMIAPDALTPTSVELKHLQNIAVSKPQSAAASASKHVMKCAAPRFPVREDDRSIVHHSTEPSPLVIERIAQSVVFPVREEQRRDDSPIYDRFDDLPEYNGIIPLWLWSTLKFYVTTKAKFFYHVVNLPHSLCDCVRLGPSCKTAEAINDTTHLELLARALCSSCSTVSIMRFRGRNKTADATSNAHLWAVDLLCAGAIWKEIEEDPIEEYAVRSNHSLAWMMFQNGAFEIFGEVDDEDKVGSVTGCEDITWKSIWTANISDVRCLFRSTLIPITVFTYMLVASIMLVNLLTALLSKEYEEVSGGGSAVYWKYENYFLLAT